MDNHYEAQEEGMHSLCTHQIVVKCITSTLLSYFYILGEYVPKASSKQSNVLPLWGNERTMNLNPLILTNIQSSHYFKGM